MYKINKIQQARYGLAASIFILGIILYVVFSVNKKNNGQAQEVTHSALVTSGLEIIYAKINELESAQRGYVITNDQSFIQSFKAIEKELLMDLARLKITVIDNPKQIKNANQLDSLILTHRQWLHLNIANQSKNRHLMGTIPKLKVLLKIDDMRKAEEKRMAQEVSVLRQWSNWSTLVIIVSVLVAAFLIIIAYMILIREYVGKLKVERELLSYQVQLKEKIEKLDMSNKDLEQFAYVASHDLQEPLRKILTFNEMINQKYDSGNTEDLKGYLDRSSNAANRMRILIDDLLTYSKSSKSGILKERVDLEVALAICKDNCEVMIQKRNVVFIHHNVLPDIVGDKTQLIQLFQNLISNAIKFTKENIQPVIEISSTIINKEDVKNEFANPSYSRYHQITIKDNGIGFNQADFKKIFIIFQRLNGRSEYEGTGIGLSICKKIVENHHGYITATSQLGQGSSFIVYLPKILIIKNEEPVAG